MATPGDSSLEGEISPTNPPWEGAEIFISYAQGDKTVSGRLRNRAVHSVVDVLRERGITVTIDWNLELGGKISEFIRRIGQGQCVIAIVSEKYLKSAFCMRELLYLSRHQDFSQRLLPVVLEDAKVESDESLEAYERHWETEINGKAIQLTKTRNPASREKVISDLEDLNAISSLISEFIRLLRDTKSIRFKDGSKEELDCVVIWVLKRRVEIEGGMPPTPPAHVEGDWSAASLSLGRISREAFSRRMTDVLYFLTVFVNGLQQQLILFLFRTQDFVLFGSKSDPASSVQANVVSLRAVANVFMPELDYVRVDFRASFREDGRKPMERIFLAIPLQSRPSRIEAPLGFEDTGLEGYDRVFDHFNERYFSHKLRDTEGSLRATAYAVWLLGGFGTTFLLIGEAFR